MSLSAYITGATGYTGRAVVQKLRERNVDTIAHIRPASSGREEYTARFRDMGAGVDVTPWELEAMAETMDNVDPDLVFFLVGTTRARARTSNEDESYEAVDYGLLSLLVDACTSVPSPPKLLYLSAMGVRKGALTAYYRARYKAEETIKESGLPYVIARPAMITGPDRRESRPLERLGALSTDIAAATLRLVGARRLADRYRSTDADELATALVDLALDEEAANIIVESEELKRP